MMRLDIRQVHQDQATDKVPAPGFEPGEQRVEIRIPGVESVDRAVPSASGAVPSVSLPYGTAMFRFVPHKAGRQ